MATRVDQERSRQTKRSRLLLIWLATQLCLGQTATAASTTRLVASSDSSVKSAQSPPLCPAQLSTAIDGVTNRTEFSRGRWGILVQALASASTLYSRDATKYFIPASNVKLLTTAAALQQLGTSFRIRTSVYGNSNGDLTVVGRGDPSLSDVQLTALAQQLRRRGVRQVNQLTAVDNYFQGTAINPTWEWEDLLADYGVPVNSLILNQNTVAVKLLPQQLGQPLRVVWADAAVAERWQIVNTSVTAKPGEPASISISRKLPNSGLTITGKLGIDAKPETLTFAVTNPSKSFLTRFHWALASAGINVTTIAPNSTQTTIDIRQRLAMRELAAIVSPPLSQLLAQTNQQSNNLYAEVLLRTLGVSATPALAIASDSTAELGLQQVKVVLTKLGVNPDSYVLADGSGLSRHNLVSPEAIAQTLHAMAKSPVASIYRASLPIAGVSGTLQHRFQGSAADGIVQAKTGSMSGVVALSGYIYPPNYEPLVFSVIVNQSDQPGANVRQAIDQIVLLLSRLHRC